MKDAEQLAREVIGADALAGIGYAQYLPWVIKGIEAARAEDNDEYTETQWDGSEGAVFESETNPWVKDPSGVAISFTESNMLGPCGEMIHFIPGVLAPMDTDEGIQRCDACEIYPGDLEAARAVAKTFGPGFTVWFHGTNGERHA